MALPIPSPTLEISQQPAEMPPSLTLSPKQPITLMQRTPSLTHMTIDPPTNATAPEDSHHPHQKHWKRHLTPRSPILLAYLASLFVTAFLFVAAVCNSGDHYAVDQLSPNENGVAILGNVSRFDLLDTHRLSVTWLIVGCGEYGLQAVDGNSNECMPLDRAVDVYLDDVSEPAFSYDPARLPVTETGERLRPGGLVSFDTEHKVGAGNQYENPLDQYTFTTSVFVVEKATNKSVPITTFAVGDAGPGDFTTTSVEVPTTNKVTYDTEDGPTTVEVKSSTIFATVRHSTRARALTFSMFAINWVLTLCSVTISSIVVRRRGKVEGGVALLPITVILSTPTIRSLYVDSPPFGIFLDVVGFFPQMLTVLGCTMVVLCVFTMQSTRDRVVTLEKGEV